MSTAVEELGKYIAETQFDHLPAEVVSETKNRIADLIAIGLSGSCTKAAGISRFCKAKGGAGSAVLWGSKEKTSPAYASLANGTMVFHLELDDVHRTSHTHPGVSCIPAAIAICEEKKLSGKSLIESVVVGYDSCIRVGLAVSPSIYVDRTHLAPGTLSVFGSAASAAKLIGLDAQTAANAIGAASYYGPTACYESFRNGAGIKDMIMGWGNLSGIYAAEMAAFGLSGPELALEGDFGFFNTVSNHWDLNRLTNRLGSFYEMMFTGVKPYACCRQHHAAVDCMLAMREKYGFRLADVKRVRVRTFVVSSRGNSKTPTTVAGAKYSIPYILGVALRYGAVWRDQFTEELLKDKELMNFASLVDVEADPELDKLYDEKWPAIVEVMLKDGRTYTERRDLPKGEPEYPCTAKDLKEKFLSLAKDAVSSDKAEQIWEMIQGLEHLDDVRKLTELLIVE